MRKPYLLILVAALVSGVIALPVPAQESGSESEDPLLLASKGRAAFNRYCASCHGREADGKGTVATMLKVEPADLRVLAQENDGKFPAERVSEFIDGRRFVQAHGHREMPIWGEALQTPLREGSDEPVGEERVAQKLRELVAYIESIQVAGETDGTAGDE